MKFVKTLFLIVCTLFSVNATAYTAYKQFQVNPIRNHSYYYSKETNNNIVKPGSNIRKVKGYTSEGDSIDTEGKAGNPNNMWETGYSYYYYDGHWYRNSSDSWQEWNSLWGWGLLGWNWYESSYPGDGAVQYYQYNPVSIGENLYIMISFCMIYLLYKYLLKRLHPKLAIRACKSP